MVQNTIATMVSPATVQVTAQVQGKLLNAYFREGQLVRKGDPLFLIDPAPFENALAQAKAQLSKDTCGPTEAMISPGACVDIEKLVGTVTGIVLELQLDEPVIADFS